MTKRKITREFTAAAAALGPVQPNPSRQFWIGEVVTMLAPQPDGNVNFTFEDKTYFCETSTFLSSTEDYAESSPDPKP
jgi:hypothetical protein